MVDLMKEVEMREDIVETALGNVHLYEIHVLSHHKAPAQ